MKELIFRKKKGSDKYSNGILAYTELELIEKIRNGEYFEFEDEDGYPTKEIHMKAAFRSRIGLWKYISKSFSIEQLEEIIDDKLTPRF